MESIAEVQFQSAIKHITGGSSGLYVIRPRWAGKRALFKMGLTKNVTTRMYAGYRHSMPYTAGSFALVAFLRVGRSFLFAREKRLLALSTGGYGFAKPVRDKEWREHFNPAKLKEDLVRLLTETRQQSVDGIIYLFDETSGDVIYRGGRNAEVDDLNTVPLGANVETRAAAPRRRIVHTASERDKLEQRYGITLAANRDTLHIRQLRNAKVSVR